MTVKYILWKFNCLEGVFGRNRAHKLNTGVIKDTTLEQRSRCIRSTNETEAR